MDKFLKNKSDIIAWLDQYNIVNYKLAKDDKYGYVANVDGDVILSFKYLSRIPVKFGNVSGSFYCNDNSLTSLSGCATTVGGIFSCSYNNLTSLKFCPENIIGSFYCDSNDINSLEFCPKIVKSNFSCSNNNLTSLEFCPETISGYFLFINNKVANLIHFPTHIGKGIYLGNNSLPQIDNNEGKCHNFKEIYKIHLEYKIVAEEKLLQSTIYDNSSLNRKNNLNNSFIKKVNLRI